MAHEDDNNNNNIIIIRYLWGNEIELEWHNFVCFGSSRSYVVYNVQHYNIIIPNSHTHTHTSVHLSVCTRFFTRKGRRLLIKTRAPPIIAGHYTFVRCGHPARRIISHHIYCILWEAHTCRHTHTHTCKKKYTVRFIESSLSTRSGNRDLLAAVYTTMSYIPFGRRGYTTV